MRSRIYLLSVLFFISTFSFFSQNIKCEKEVYFGNTKICLPKIAAMTECYSIPIIKNKTARVIGSEMNVFGFYLTNEFYKKIDMLDEIPFDSYLVVYGQENMKNVTGNINDLDNVFLKLKSSYKELEWNTYEFEIEDLKLNVGRPLLLETYSSDENMRSLVYITYVSANGIDFIGITIQNLMLIKNKLLFSVYYYDYDGPISIKEAKSKNDYLALSILSANNN